jgi:hypothetical protein
MSAPRPATFQTQEGETKQLEVLDSEMESYPYAKTETFEAVVLPCNNGYMLAILPAPGRTIQDLERDSATQSFAPPDRQIACPSQSKNNCRSVAACGRS